MSALNSLMRDEEGQDLVEYMLVVSILVLASSALFLGAGGNVNAIWESGSGTLYNAANAANPVNSSDSGNGSGDGHSNGNGDGHWDGHGNGHWDGHGNGHWNGHGNN